MHATFSRLRTASHARLGMRLLILALLAIATYAYYTSPYDHAIFIGMVRSSDDPSAPALLTNLLPIAFMTGAVALPLGSPLEFLASPDYLVYVRRPRTIGHFGAYLTVLILYCTTLCCMELALAIIIQPAETATLVPGAACAMLTLLSLILIIDAGHLAGGAPYGYLAAITLYATAAAVSPVLAWFAQPSHGLPLCALLAAIFAGGILLLFSRLEIR